MNKPKLSIIVCTYNRDKYLIKCLGRLSNQSAEKNLYEIIVINNNSDDDTEKVCLNFKQDHPELLYKYILEERQGLSYSRNRGIIESAGELISYIDDDAFADNAFAQNLIQYFEQNPAVGAIGGKVTPEYQEDPPSWMSRYLLPLVAALDKGNHPKPFRGMEFPIGANMAFRRLTLERVELFDTQLGRKGHFLGSGEEKDLFYRLKKKNCKIHYVPDVKVSHSIPKSRLKPEYIKRMAQGVGQSEAFRISKTSFTQIIGKWLMEFFKIGATLILGLLFLTTGQWEKASMLVKFRIWVFSSFIKGSL